VEGWPRRRQSALPGNPPSELPHRTDQPGHKQVVPRRVKHIKAQRRPIALQLSCSRSMNGNESVSGRIDDEINRLFAAIREAHGGPRSSATSGFTRIARA